MSFAVGVSRARCYTPCALGGIPMGCGVTGNTADSGSVIQGSIPCTPTPSLSGRKHSSSTSSSLAPSSSGLGHHPLKVAARVRIPLGLPANPRSEPLPQYEASGSLVFDQPASSRCACSWRTRSTTASRSRVGPSDGSASSSRMSARSTCLLYTSDAADDLLCVDIGGRRFITKKHNNPSQHHEPNIANSIPIYKPNIPYQLNIS